MAKEKHNIGERRDWTGLPEELLHLIYKKLPDLRDFIRFRTVCKSWYSTAPLSDPPEQQLPWLLDASRAPVLTTKQMFYTLGSGELGSFDIEPCNRGKLFCGACREYLLLSFEHNKDYEGQHFALFNPLTNSYILLENLPQGFFASSWRSFDSYCPVWINNNDPISNNNIYVFFLTHDCRSFPAIYNQRSKEWVAINCCPRFTTCCYMKGMFFGTYISGHTSVFCEKSSQPLLNVPPPVEDLYFEFTANYLIACSGVILRVYLLDKFENVKSCKFLLYRLGFHVGDAHPNWVRISGIGDHMLFLDEMNGFSTRARPTDGFKGNCIYFLYPWPSGRPYRYDITTGTAEPVPCPFRECRWFLPGLSGSQYLDSPLSQS